MYCIECGIQIPNNSKFCSHCGHEQTEGETSSKEKIVEVIIEEEKPKQAVEAHKSSIDYQILKKAMGWYLAWVLIHLGLLLIGSNGIFDEKNMGSEKFWPFNDCFQCDGVGNYDITEFLVYTIFPLAILFILSMLSAQAEDWFDPL